MKGNYTQTKTQDTRTAKQTQQDFQTSRQSQQICQTARQSQQNCQTDRHESLASNNFNQPIHCTTTSSSAVISTQHTTLPTQTPNTIPSTCTSSNRHLGNISALPNSASVKTRCLHYSHHDNPKDASSETDSCQPSNYNLTKVNKYQTSDVPINHFDDDKLFSATEETNVTVTDSFSYIGNKNSAFTRSSKFNVLHYSHHDRPLQSGVSRDSPVSSYHDRLLFSNTNHVKHVNSKHVVFAEISPSMTEHKIHDNPNKNTTHHNKHQSAEVYLLYYVQVLL